MCPWIDKGQSDSQITCVKIKFETVERLVNIQRESYSFEVAKSVYYTRRKFPIMLVFVITVHKAQGLSLRSAIVAWYGIWTSVLEASLFQLVIVGSQKWFLKF